MQVLITILILQHELFNLDLRIHVEYLIEETWSDMIIVITIQQTWVLDIILMCQVRYDHEIIGVRIQSVESPSLVIIFQSMFWTVNILGDYMYKMIPVSTVHSFIIQ